VQTQNRLLNQIFIDEIAPLKIQLRNAHIFCCTTKLLPITGNKKWCKFDEKYVKKGVAKFCDSVNLTHAYFFFNGKDKLLINPTVKSLTISSREIDNMPDMQSYP